MQCKCKRKYKISIVSSVRVRPVNKIAFEGIKKNKLEEFNLDPVPPTPPAKKSYLYLFKARIGFT